jgi:hypothetical protein
MRNIVQIGDTASTYDLTTVEAANTFLGLTSSPDADAQLQAEITAASRIIATQCDRVFAMETVAQTFVMRSGETITALVLDRVPIAQISEVNDCGQILSPDDYEIDTTKGILWRTQWPQWGFGVGSWWGNRRIVVTYSGGYELPDEAPPDLALACQILIKEQRFARVRGDPTIRSVRHENLDVFYQQGTAAFTTGQGAFPPSVSQLIEPYKLPAVA